MFASEELIEGYSSLDIYNPLVAHKAATQAMHFTQFTQHHKATQSHDRVQYVH